MKKGENIRNLLGITQEELAVLLNITRSQLSLFEIGKREIPTEAMTKLANMYLSINNNTSSSEKLSEVIKTQEEHKKQTLEALLKDNKYYQLVCAKKIEKAEKKYNNNMLRLQLVMHLEKEAKHQNIVKSMELKTNSDIMKNGLAQLTKLKIEKEVLQAEEKKINIYLNKT